MFAVKTLAFGYAIKKKKENDIRRSKKNYYLREHLSEFKKEVLKKKNFVLEYN